MRNIEEIWSRIKSLQGEKFYQIRGAEFTYGVYGGHVIPDRTRQQIPKSHFKKALEYVPLINTTPLQKKLRGPSYIYAILMDDRIRQDDW